mgnify:CR=1 FL=1
MKFFIDTANVEDIKKANDMGVICGVTTNPSLIAKEGRDFKEVIKEITTIVDGPISGEVKATTVDAEGMIKEGREIAAIHPNMVVKIPMTCHGGVQRQDHIRQVVIHHAQYHGAGGIDHIKGADAEQAQQLVDQAVFFQQGHPRIGAQQKVHPHG